MHIATRHAPASTLARVPSTFFPPRPVPLRSTPFHSFFHPLSTPFPTPFHSFSTPFPPALAPPGAPEPSRHGRRRDDRDPHRGSCSRGGSVDGVRPALPPLVLVVSFVYRHRRLHHHLHCRRRRHRHYCLRHHRHRRRHKPVRSNPHTEPTNGSTLTRFEIYVMLRRLLLTCVVLVMNTLAQTVVFVVCVAIVTLVIEQECKVRRLGGVRLD